MIRIVGIKLGNGADFKWATVNMAFSEQSPRLVGFDCSIHTWGIEQCAQKMSFFFCPGAIPVRCAVSDESCGLLSVNKWQDRSVNHSCRQVAPGRSI